MFIAGLVLLFSISAVAAIYFYYVGVPVVLVIGSFIVLLVLASIIIALYQSWLQQMGIVDDTGHRQPIEASHRLLKAL